MRLGVTLFTRRSLSWLAWLLTAISAAAVVADVTLRLVTPQDQLPELARTPTVDLLDNAAILGLPLLGGLVASRRPQNVLGWLFLIAGLGLSLGEFGSIYVARDLYIDDGALPLGLFFGWLSNFSWAIGVGTLPFLTLLFPTGKVASKRWRPFLLVSLVLYAVLVFGAAALATLIWHAPLTPDDQFPESVQIIEPPLILALFGLTLMAAVGLVSLVFRYRAAGLEEREQLKWFVVTVSFLVFVLAMDNASHGILIDWGVFLAQLALYAALAVSILKYRLYDIDIIINRTLVYAPLTAILAGLFVAMQTLFRALVTDITDAGSDASIAFSTLAVVALLTPLKNRLQAFVDRHFKEQHDPLGSLKRLTNQAESVVQVLDVEEFAQSVLSEIMAGLNAEAATIETGDRYFSLGLANGAEPITLPLEYRDEQIGTLKIWPAFLLPAKLM